jgi:mycofactocin precursor
MPPSSSVSVAHQRRREYAVSEPQVLEPTELESDSASHGEVADRVTAQPPPADEVLDDDLLVEEISIDGMCGVY